MKTMLLIAIVLSPTLVLASAAYAETCVERCYRIHGYTQAGHSCASRC